MKTRRFQRGSTVMEVGLAAFLTAAALFTAVSVFLLGMSSWYKGQGNIDAISNSEQAVREVSKALREAFTVTVDNNGQGLTYQCLAKDNNGNFIPQTSDGVNRRIELVGTTLQITGDNNSRRTICRGIITTDPQSDGGNGTYQIFTPGAGAKPRSITVMLVSRMNSYKDATVTSRSRETIYLRNIPELAN